MTYTEEARALRRCQARTKRDQDCQRYAVWGDTQGRCSAHGGRVNGAHVIGKTAYEPCHCVAYRFPHRPGSGLCEWPTPTPTYRLNMRPGTHARGRSMWWLLVPGRARQPSCILAWWLWGTSTRYWPHHDTA